MKSFGQILRITLRERKIVPGDLAAYIKAQILAKWNNMEINENIAKEIADIVISYASVGGLELLDSDRKTIEIDLSTPIQAGINIKEFVDAVIAACERFGESLIKSHPNNEEYLKFYRYFQYKTKDDNSRKTDLYTELVKRIKKEYGVKNIIRNTPV